MANIGIVESIIIWMVNVVTLIASVIFLKVFISLKEKSAGSYMIFILNLFAFVFPITDLIGKFVPLNVNQLDLVYAAEVASYRFSLFWTAVLAIFTYIILTKQKQINTRCYLVVSMISCLVMTAIFPYTIIGNIWNLDVSLDEQGFLGFKSLPGTPAGRVGFFIVYNLIGKLIPVIIISICYIKVYKSLKCKKNQLKNYSASNMNMMLWYSFTPILCFVPGAVIDIVLLGKDFPLWANFIVNLSYRLWGLINLLTYWSVQQKENNDDEGDGNVDLANAINHTSSTASRCTASRNLIM